MTQFVNPKKIYPLREKRRNNTRAVLVKTCNKLLNENGYRNLTMQNVADVAGIHVQTLYKHFPTKFSLLLQIEGVSQLRADSPVGG